MPRVPVEEVSDGHLSDGHEAALPALRIQCRTHLDRRAQPRLPMASARRGR